EGRRPDVAANREIHVDERADALGVTESKIVAARGDVEIRRHIPVEPDPPAEAHEPATHRRRHVVQTDAARVEADGAVDRVERVGDRQVTHAPAGDGRAARELWLPERSIDRGGQLGAPGTADA